MALTGPRSILHVCNSRKAQYNKEISWLVATLKKRCFAQTMKNMKNMQQKMSSQNISAKKSLKKPPLVGAEGLGWVAFISWHLGCHLFKVFYHFFSLCMNLFTLRTEKNCRDSWVGIHSLARRMLVSLFR